jgi:hypothetical protein
VPRRRLSRRRRPRELTRLGPSRATLNVLEVQAKHGEEDSPRMVVYTELTTRWRGSAAVARYDEQFRRGRANPGDERPEDTTETTSRSPGSSTEARTSVIWPVSYGGWCYAMAAAQNRLGKSKLAREGCGRRNGSRGSLLSPGVQVRTEGRRLPRSRPWRRRRRAVSVK